MKDRRDGYRTYTIYENQKRKHLVWAAPPSVERPVWSDENGQPRTKSEYNKLTDSMEGWSWIGDWTIDKSNERLGKDGWEFASAWPKFGKRAARDWANPGDSVRRRKWIRTMQCNTASQSSDRVRESPRYTYEDRQHNIVKAIKILNGTNKDITAFVERIGTERDSTKDRANVEEIFDSTEARLQEVENELDNLKEDGGSTMRGTIIKLGKDVQKVKNQLQKSRKTYEIKVRRNPLQSEDFSERGSSYDSGGKMSASVKQDPPKGASEQPQYDYVEHERAQYPGDGLDPEGQKIDAQLIGIDEVQINEAIMLEREQEIGKINKDLLQVQEITQDLHDLVEGQQSAIDEITNNVEQTEIRTRTGLKEVQQAEKSQKQACIVS